MKHIPYLLTLLCLFLAGLSACTPDTQAGLDLSAGSVLFQDGFTNLASGWMQGEDEVGITEYSQEGFRIYITSETAAKVSIPRLSFTDIRLEVDATKLGGPDDNEFGLVCRYKDQDNFYFFTISSDGYYGIGKYNTNRLSLIGMEQMQSSDLILQGQATNHIRADCVGSRLTLYINGQKVKEVEDTDFSSGDVGLIAGTFATPGADILFDNFSALKP